MLLNRHHIIVLTETWFEHSSDEAFHSVEGYNVFRSDRSLYKSNRCGGGGCLIAISKKLIGAPFIIVKDNAKHIFFKGTNRSDKCIIGATYLSRECAVDKYASHANLVESIATRYQDFKLLLFGDYNFSDIGLVMRASTLRLVLILYNLLSAKLHI